MKTIISMLLGFLGLLALCALTIATAIHIRNRHEAVKKDTIATDTMRAYYHQQAKINYWLWLDKKVPYDSVAKYQRLEQAD